MLRVQVELRMQFFVIHERQSTIHCHYIENWRVFQVINDILTWQNFNIGSFWNNTIRPGSWQTPELSFVRDRNDFNNSKIAVNIDTSDTLNTNVLVFIFLHGGSPSKLTGFGTVVYVV